MIGGDSTKLAHNLDDPKKPRSRDVISDEDITFAQLNLSDRTVEGLALCSFHKPSPIQLKAIPIGRCGFDTVIRSKAGTGKTCIFSVIALEALCSGVSASTQTLILAPTREVAIQIHHVISSLSRNRKSVGCALFVGGVDVKSDRKQLADEPCQIVVGTPGRIKQLIDLNLLKTQQIELFVLDEADKLIEDQFKSQIDSIYKQLPLEKQMIATSATYPPALCELLKRYMRSAQYISVSEDIFLEAVEEHFVLTKAGHSVHKAFEFKTAALKKLLGTLPFVKCIVFTNYQARAPIICGCLNRSPDFVEKHGQCDYISAELSQEERVNIFRQFRTSEQGLLVSTDLSARGIDISEIDLVVNLDIPPDKSTYYHRIGRSGRFGQPGRAISIVADETIDKELFKKSVHSERLIELQL